jgi:hypothetical protein
MQTSVEWLVQQICGEHTKVWYDLIQKAKEMHNHEIIESYCQGCKDISEDDSIFPRETAEEYYKNLFGYKL